MEFVSSFTAVGSRNMGIQNTSNHPSLGFTQTRTRNVQRHDEVIDLTTDFSPVEDSDSKSSPTFSDEDHCPDSPTVPEDELVIISAAEFAQLEQARRQWNVMRIALDLAYLDIDNLRAAADTERRIRDHLETHNHHLAVENRRLQTNNQLLQMASRDVWPELGGEESPSDCRYTCYGHDRDADRDSGLEIVLATDDEQTSLEHSMFDYEMSAQLAQYPYKSQPTNDQTYRQTQDSQYQNLHTGPSNGYVDLTIEE